MSFTELSFLLLFLPITFLAYNLCRGKWILQNLVLLLASGYFYYCYGIGNLLVLLLCILLTYFGGLLGSRLLTDRPRAGKRILVGTAVLNLLILGFFKYALFALTNVNLLLSTFGGAIPLPEIALPIGLSFFIFQSSSYLFDLKNGKVAPEKNFINYAVFVSFFPTIVSGPIQKSRDFLPKLRTERKIAYRDVQRALMIFLWGVFVKMVIADRVAIFTAEVFDHYTEHGGFVLAIAAVMYSIQIYADFAGYSYMAIACGVLFGFEMQDNFNQPYFGKSIVDFWRRWHISLTSWFREYLYFPLGGNRKGTFRKYLNVMIVFLVSGLWHGSSWNFVVWGFIHAVYQIVGTLTQAPREKLYGKLKIDMKSPIYRVWQSVWVFLLATFAWIFFRITSIKDGIGFVARMFTEWNPWVLFDKSLFELGLSAQEWNVLLASLALLLAVSFLREKGIRADRIVEQKLPIRWAVYLLLIAAIVVFGIYGPGYSANNFIYAGF